MALHGRTCLVALLLGSGCGGPPAPVQPPRDRTPPAIQLRTPAAGSAEGTLSDPVVIVFSEPLDPSATSTVQAEFEVDGSVSSASITLVQGATLVLAQDTPFGLRAHVQVRLKGQVKDLAGNVLSLDGEGWTFIVPTFDLLARDLPYELCGMVQRGSDIWLSDCQGLARLAPDGGTTPWIRQPGYVDLFTVQSPPGEIFAFAESEYPGKARVAQLFRLDEAANMLDPMFSPLPVDADALSWILAADAAHPVAALQTRPPDAGVGEFQLLQWSAAEWAGLTRPIPGRALSFVVAEGGLYAFLLPPPDGVNGGTARAESDGGWSPVGLPFPVDGPLGVDAHGALVRSAPWYKDFRLERWNGIDWEPISDFTFPFPATGFAFDSRNTPVVVTVDPRAISVRRLTATGWRKVGESFRSDGYQYNPRISFDPEDLAVVAWSDNSFPAPITSFVARESR